MDAVLVVPVASDEPEERIRDLLKSVGRLDAVFAVDEDYPHSWLLRYGHVVRTQGFGIGKALEAGFRYAVNDLGAEWVVRSDAHIVFLDKPETLLVYRDRVNLASTCLQQGNNLTCVHGSYITYDTWEWRWNHTLHRPLPNTTEPVFAIHRDLIKKLWSLQGEAFAVPYWGREGHDITMTLARLGHYTMPLPTKVIHHYKKEWPRERVVRPCIGEPWCSDLGPGENPYFTAIYISYVIYAHRHYPIPQIMPFWNQIPERPKQLAYKYMRHKLTYFSLGIPTEQVYQKLSLL